MICISVYSITLIFTLIFQLIQVNSQLIGQGIPCTKEGAKINLADVTRGLVTSPCYHCICKVGVIHLLYWTI
ncbi:hypothetical protein QQG55_21975 [Brugia pahangi]